MSCWPACPWDGGTHHRPEWGACQGRGATRIWICGPSLFAGYYDNARANEATFHDGWFRTGDLASFDVGGNIRITGRLNELINRGGVKINPVDVEATIEKHPNVLQCAIVRMPDEFWVRKAARSLCPALERA